MKVWLAKLICKKVRQNLRYRVGKKMSAHINGTTVPATDVLKSPEGLKVLRARNISWLVNFWYLFGGLRISANNSGVMLLWQCRGHLQRWLQFSERQSSWIKSTAHRQAPIYLGKRLVRNDVGGFEAARCGPSFHRKKNDRNGPMFLSWESEYKMY